MLIQGTHLLQFLHTSMHLLLRPDTHTHAHSLSHIHAISLTHRNSKRMELLLVRSTHPLAPTIYELQAAFSHLASDEERAEKVGGGSGWGQPALHSHTPCPECRGAARRLT